MTIKSLPIQSFRRPNGGVPAWMQQARILTNHHPITGQLITDKDLNTKIMKTNQAAVDRQNSVGREFAEKDAETDQELVDLFNMQMIKK